jgi:hypothetical protein
MSNGVAAGLRSGSWSRNVVAARSVSLMLMSSQQRVHGQNSELLFSKGFLVTGNARLLFQKDLGGKQVPCRAGGDFLRTLA